MFTIFEGKENIQINNTNKIIKKIIFFINLNGHKESLTFRNLVTELDAIRAAEIYLYGNTKLNDCIYLEKIKEHETLSNTYYIQCGYV